MPFADHDRVSVPAKTVTHVLIDGVISLALLLAALFGFRLQVTPMQRRFDPATSGLAK